MKKTISFVIAALLIFINCSVFAIECAASSEKKWVFYINSNDNDRLYKMLSDGTNITKLSDRIVSGAVICDDFIYFTVSSKSVPPRYSYGLFRIKTDGSSEEILIENVLHGNMIDIDGIYKWKDYICIPCYSDYDSRSAMLIYKNNKLCKTATFYEFVDTDNYLDFETDHWSDLDWEKYYSDPENGYFDGYYFNGIKTGYVYLTSCKDGSYRKIKIDDLSSLKEDITDTDIFFSESIEVKNLPEKLIEVKKLPEKFDIRENLPSLSTDYYREKRLAWKKENGCKKYRISKYDENKKNFSVIFETDGASAIIPVLNSEYDLEYKVTAVKKLNGKEIYTDIPLKKYHAKEYCTGNGGGAYAKYGDMYMICLSDGIYYVNKDGKKVSKISGDTAESIYYADGTVYYITVPDNFRRKLYSITADGKNKKELYFTGCEILSFTVTNKSIYFNEFNEDWYSSSIIKIDRESGEISTIIGGGAIDPIINGMCFYDDKIFYSCDESEDNIISADPDGSKQRIIARKGSRQMFQHDGKLYFLSGGLCCVNTDGSEFVCLNNEDVFAESNESQINDDSEFGFLNDEDVFAEPYGFQINDDRLYFVKKGSIYSAEINGTNVKKILDSKKYFVDYFSVYDNVIIFISNKKMYFYDLSKSKIIELGNIA